MEEAASNDVMMATVDGTDSPPIITITSDDDDQSPTEPEPVVVIPRQSPPPVQLNRINSGPMSEGYVTVRRRNTPISAVTNNDPTENISLFISCLLLVGVSFLFIGLSIHYYNQESNDELLTIFEYLLLAIGFTSSSSSIIYLIGYFINRISSRRHHPSVTEISTGSSRSSDRYRANLNSGCRGPSTSTSSTTTSNGQTSAAATTTTTDEFGALDSFSFLNVDDLDHIQSTSHLDRDKWTTISDAVRPQDYLNSFGDLPVIQQPPPPPPASSTKTGNRSANKRRTIFDSFTFGCSGEHSNTANNHHPSFRSLHRFSFMGHKSESKSELLANCCEQESENMLFNIDQFEINHSTVPGNDNVDEDGDECSKQITILEKNNDHHLNNHGPSSGVIDQKQKRFVIVQFNNVKNTEPAVDTVRTPD